MAYNIKAAIRAAKNMQYEPIEVKVREATNNDPWGQSTSVMSDIARATHHHDEYGPLFKMVWKRLNDSEHVMHVQKALILTDYLLRNGAERFINDAKRRSRDISALQKYKQYDANNRDVGGEVRAKAKAVYELLTNDAKLAEERGKAQAIRDVKLSGMGSDGYGPGMGGEGGGDDRDRDEHRDRFTEGGEGGEGADSPRGDREHDWEKEHEDYAPPAKGGDEEKEERKKKKKAKAAAATTEEEAPEDGDKEKKKKEKRKKKKSSADEAPPAVAAASSSAAPTASSSAVTSSASTPAFTASSASLDSFDAFASNGAFAANVVPVAVITASGATAAPAAGLAQPGDADKPKKSRKSKKGAEEAAAVPATAAAPSSAPSVQVGGEYDLTTFASIPTPRGPASSDLDILTGTNAPVGRLEDMFASSSLQDQPLDVAQEEDGFAVEEEPALLDMIQEQTQAQQAATGGASAGGGAVEKKKASDVWDLGADFTNIDNLTGAVPKKKTAMREEVSMSMMRGMQPFGGGGGQHSASAAPQQSFAAPASASSPFFSVPSAGGGYGGAPMGGMGGMGMGMGGGGHGSMGGPPAVGGGFGGMPGGFGQPMQGPPAGFHAPPAGGMGGGIGPFVGMGGFGGMGGPPQGGAGGGGGGMLGSDLPFAAPQGGGGPRSGGSSKMPANGKPLIFDAVPQARQQLASAAQPTTASGGPSGPKWNR